MAMMLKTILVIEVADSDVNINRRLSNTRAQSDSTTTNYYTNDNPEKRLEISSWFNSFDEQNIFHLNVERVKCYLELLQSRIIPHRKLFNEDLFEINDNIKDLKISIDGFDKIELDPMVNSGESDRYLRFNSNDPLSLLLKKVIIGRITNIIILKDDHNFEVFLDLSSKYKKKLIDAGLEQDNPVYLDDVDRSEVLIEIDSAYNKIYYGVPGSGKSYYVDKEYSKNNSIIFRTTFYNDYSNSDFVGQIMPQVTDDGKIFYDFIPGVFSNALLNALNHPDKKTVLIIEEINRGNASAIFGDIFHLLDRKTNGESQYKIDNPIIEKWLKDNGHKLEGIYIPKNLYIIATMNSSDQNVYTLDTAFKRRWDMENISNNFNSSLDWFDYYIPGSNMTWRTFVTIVNEFTLTIDSSGLLDEDKRLGVYFVNKNDLCINSLDYSDISKMKSFAHKVLMYLWEDVSKLNRDQWFIPGIKSLDDLVEKFITKDDEYPDSLSVFSFFP